MARSRRPRLTAAVILAAGLVQACAPDALPPEAETATTSCIVGPVTAEARGESQFQGVSRDGEWLTYAGVRATMPTPIDPWHRAA